MSVLANAAPAAIEAARGTIPTVKALTGWSPSAVGIWSILLVQLFILGGLAIRKGPEWIRAIGDRRKQDADVEAGERAEQRAENATISARLTGLESRIERTGGALVFLIGAVTTAIDGLESDDKRVRDIAAGRARESIAMAANALGDKDPFSDMLARLANAPAVLKKAGE